jgi:hypothetical protein
VICTHGPGKPGCVQLCGPVAHLEGQDSVVGSTEVRQARALDRIDAVPVHSPEDLASRVAALPDRGDAVRQTGEARADLLRRLDGRLDPLALVHFMLEDTGRGWPAATEKRGAYSMRADPQGDG